MFTESDLQEWKSWMQRVYPAGIAIATAPETIQVIAAGYRRLFGALLDVGFTEAQALVVAAGGFRSHHVSANGDTI
ncbi:MAG TPA: hypothetical protein VGT98_14190 [Candidatus Elarobacter sp.]|nr:hypothetical protein [Candidatus Elarobacter sp.]